MKTKIDVNRLVNDCIIELSSASLGATFTEEILSNFTDSLVGSGRATFVVGMPVFVYALSILLIISIFYG